MPGDCVGAAQVAAMTPVQVAGSKKKQALPQAQRRKPRKRGK